MEEVDGPNLTLLLRFSLGSRGLLFIVIEFPNSSLSLSVQQSTAVLFEHFPLSLAMLSVLTRAPCSCGRLEFGVLLTTQKSAA